MFYMMLNIYLKKKSQMVGFKLINFDLDISSTNSENASWCLLTKLHDGPKKNYAPISR